MERLPHSGEPIGFDPEAFVVGAAVRVVLQERADSGEFGDTGRSFTGVVVAPPSWGFDQQPLAGVNVMPDVPVPHGHKFRSHHPRLITGKPFDYIGPEGPNEQKRVLRFGIQLVLPE